MFNSNFDKIDSFINDIILNLQINNINEVDYIIELANKYRSFLELLYSYNNDDNLYNSLIYFLVEYVKIISNNLLYVYENYNNKNLFYLITILANFDDNTVNSKKYIKISKLKEKIKDPLLLEMIKYFISNLNFTNNENQHFLLSTYLKTKYNINLFFNICENYNITDFLLSLTILFTNINCSFIQRTIFNDDLINQDINNTTKNLKYNNNILNLLENKTFDNIMINMKNYKENDINNTFNYPLSLNVLLKHKKLCYHYQLYKYDNTCDLLLLNFLYNFEKSIRKFVKKNITEKDLNLSELSFNNLVKNDIINNIKNINYCYNIEFFIKIYVKLLENDYDYINKYYNRLKSGVLYVNNKEIDDILKFYNILIFELLLDKPLTQHKEYGFNYFFNILISDYDIMYNYRFITFRKRKFYSELFDIYEKNKNIKIDNFMQKFNNKFIKKSLHENIVMTDKDFFIDSYAKNFNYNNINCLNFYEHPLNIYRPSYRNKKEFEKTLDTELLIFFKIKLSDNDNKNIIFNLNCNYNDDVFNKTNEDNKQSVITININKDIGYIEFFISDSNNFYNQFTDIIFKFVYYFFKHLTNSTGNNNKRKFGIYVCNNKNEIYDNDNEFIIDLIYSENEIFGEEDHMLIFDNFFNRIKTELYNFIRIKYFNKYNITPLIINNKIIEFLLLFNQPCYFYYVFGKYIYNIINY